MFSSFWMIAAFISAGINGFVAVYMIVAHPEVLIATLLILAFCLIKAKRSRRKWEDLQRRNDKIRDAIRAEQAERRDSLRRAVERGVQLNAERRAQDAHRRTRVTAEYNDGPLYVVDLTDVS